jgi:ribosomal protein S18 acetylase RimI-like enzyme
MALDAITIRPAMLNDADELLALWREAAYGASPTDDEGALETMLSRDAGALLLACDDGHIVGSIIAAWDGWRANLYRLAVLEAYRRTGVGALLLREAERRLRGLGARRISALVEIDNETGRVFWESQGYAVATSQMRCYKDVG